MANYLKSKFVVGSCKGPVDYAAKETAFHRGDIPARKRENKVTVDRWKKGESTWNQSVQLEDFGRPRRTRMNSEHDRPNMYRYNFRAEHMPPENLEFVHKAHKFKIDALTKERKEEIARLRASDSVLAGHSKSIEEMPVNRKLQGKLRWNGSTEVSQRELKQSFRSLQLKAKKSSAQKCASLASYTPPHKAPKKSDRPEEEDEKESRSPHKNRLVARRRTKQIRSYPHSGVFEYNGLEGSWMWSDTASCVQNSPGDMIKVC